MKKILLNKLLAPIGKGFLIFAVFGLALYAYAAVDFPADDPAPVTGVVGQFVGFSNTQINGAQSGYLSANDACNIAIPDSHICIAEEITRSYVNGNPAITNATSSPGSTPNEWFAWINNGAPGYFANVNDCLGWTANASTSYAAVWNVKGSSFAINHCGNTRRFACCM